MDLDRGQVAVLLLPRKRKWWLIVTIDGVMYPFVSLFAFGPFTATPWPLMVACTPFALTSSTYICAFLFDCIIRTARLGPFYTYIFMHHLRLPHAISFFDTRPLSRTSGAVNTPYYNLYTKRSQCTTWAGMRGQIISARLSMGLFSRGFLSDCLEPYQGTSLCASSLLLPVSGT